MTTGHKLTPEFSQNLQTTLKEVMASVTPKETNEPDPNLSNAMSRSGADEQAGEEMEGEYDVDLLIVPSKVRLRTASASKRGKRSRRSSKVKPVVDIKKSTTDITKKPATRPTVKFEDSSSSKNTAPKISDNQPTTASRKSNKSSAKPEKKDKKRKK